jgi:cell division protein FtsB
MADLTRLNAAVTAAVAKIESLKADNATLSARVTDLQNQLAAIDPKADQVPVDALAGTLEAEVAKA